MNLTQAVRLQRRLAERQLRAVQRIGRWPNSVRRTSLSVLRAAFAAKPAQIRAMVDAGADPAAVREYAESRCVVL